MKKVMIVCNSLRGLRSFRKELLERLLKDKNEVIVLGPEDNISKDLIEMGCKFIPVEMESRGTNPIKDLKLMRTYKKIIKKEKPDVVLTYTIKPNVYAGYVCGRLHIPYIPNVTGLGTSVEQPGLLQKITLFLYKLGLKKAKCVFFQNQDNLDFMKKHKVVKDNYQLIPGSGVNLEHHKLLPYPKDKTIRFLFISRILYEKGIEEYFEVAKYIKKKYPNTEFHILGSCDNEKYSEMIKELEKDNIIIYHGRVDDVREYHKISNCTIHPSFYPEGMSNVLLESCAAGRPIITTNRPGCKEIVEDGINGYLIECQDTEALKEKVEQFINLSNEEKKQMGLNGRKKVEKEFDRNIVVENYLDRINPVLSHPIRILHVLGGLNAGGAETFVMNLYKKMDTEIIQFDFVVHSNKKGFYEGEITKLGGKVYRIPKYNGLNHFCYCKAWNTFFCNHPEYKIIHSHIRSTASIILRIAKKYNLKTISHSHSTSNGNGIEAIIKKIYQKKIPKYSDLMMACSKSAAKWLYGLKDSKSAIIVNNGIDINKFKFSKKYRKEIRDLYSIDDNCILLGHIGRFTDAKNHHFLIELIQLIADNKRNYKLMLIGAGELKEEIISEINRRRLSKYIIFVEPNSEVNKYYSAFDLFLFPSKYEGLGIVLIEAQISGLKCLISNYIPKEAIITENVNIIPLKKEMWANQIVLIGANKINRNDVKKTPSYDNYDINVVSKKVEKVYLKLFDKM